MMSRALVAIALVEGFAVLFRDLFSADGFDVVAVVNVLVDSAAQLAADVDRGEYFIGGDGVAETVVEDCLAHLNQSP